MTTQSGATAATVFRHAANVRVRRYRGRLFVAAGDQALELEEAAETVFRGVDGTATAGEIAHRLSELYEVPEDEAVADSLQLLEALTEHGVLEVVS
jgi:pyrroloquinoline quinone biosynthesis protein D